MENPKSAPKPAADIERRLMTAELKLAARAKGILDLDFLKLLDMSAVKMDADGNVENADEVIEAFKVSKPHMFGQTAKTSKSSPHEGQQFDAMKMSDAEFNAAVKNLGRADAQRHADRLHAKFMSSLNPSAQPDTATPKQAGTLTGTTTSMTRAPAPASGSMSRNAMEMSDVEFNAAVRALR